LRDVPLPLDNRTVTTRAPVTPAIGLVIARQPC
jgi:hypothetical protein